MKLKSKVKPSGYVGLNQLADAIAFNAIAWIEKDILGGFTKKQKAWWKRKWEEMEKKYEKDSS
jgi:hypothetical protein